MSPSHFAMEFLTFAYFFRVFRFWVRCLVFFPHTKICNTIARLCCRFSYLLPMDANSQHTVLTIDIPILHNEAIIRFRTFHRLG